MEGKSLTKEQEPQERTNRGKAALLRAAGAVAIGVSKIGPLQEITAVVANSSCACGSCPQCLVNTTIAAGTTVLAFAGMLRKNKNKKSKSDTSPPK